MPRSVWIVRPVIPVPKMIAQPESGWVHLYHPEIRAGDEVGIEAPSQRL
jgi:hypothetical protein